MVKFAALTKDICNLGYIELNIFLSYPKGIWSKFKTNYIIKSAI